MPLTMASSGHGVGDAHAARGRVRNESRWPAGCGLRIGSITGRPYVGKVARDERAEGVAA